MVTVPVTVLLLFPLPLPPLLSVPLLLMAFPGVPLAGRAVVNGASEAVSALAGRAVVNGASEAVSALAGFHP
ncbi:transporter [Escherichia coli]